MSQRQGTHAYNYTTVVNVKKLIRDGVFLEPQNPSWLLYSDAYFTAITDRYFRENGCGPAQFHLLASCVES